MDELDKNFSAINRLPPYIFEQINSLKMEARRKGEDVIDFSMGNPDGETQKALSINLLRPFRGLILIDILNPSAYQG